MIRAMKAGVDVEITARVNAAVIAGKCFCNADGGPIRNVAPLAELTNNILNVRLISEVSREVAWRPDLHVYSR